jgi:hypothetical protein
VGFGQTLKHVAVLLGMMPRSSATHTILCTGSISRPEAAIGCEREEWSDEVDAAKVMESIRLRLRRIDAMMNWAGKCGNMNRKAECEYG